MRGSSPSTVPGEQLYSDYYGEYSDYTRKGGVVCSEILLPSHAPAEYQGHQTLWNAVEKAKCGKNAQLAYSFDIALQNEFSIEENIALARQFLLEQFVSRGMVVNFAVHQSRDQPSGLWKLRVSVPTKSTNTLLNDLKQKAKTLLSWIADIRKELSAPKSLTLGPAGSLL